MSIAVNQEEANYLADQFLRHFADLIVAVCEHAHSRVCRVLKTRAQVHTDLPLINLKQVFQLSLDFIEATEVKIEREKNVNFKNMFLS